MRFGLVLVGAAAVAFGATADATPRPGKVVRVERPKQRFGTPRYCAVGIGDLQAYCYGKRPEAGEHITVVDLHHVLGVLRVDSTEPLGNCPHPLWVAHVQVESGDVQTPNDSQVGGLLDVTLDPRGGRLMKVDQVPGDRPISPEAVIAVDTDGDSNPDLAFQLFACDDQNNPTSNPAVQCFEVWASNGHGLEHLRTDRVMQSCN